MLAAIGHEDASWRPSENGQRSLAMLSEALRAAALEDDDPLRIGALASMGRAATFTGDRRQARELGEEALNHARASGDDGLTAHALGASLWQGLTRSGSLVVARALELQEIGSRLGDDDHLGPAAFHRGAFGYMVGDEPAWSSAQRDLTDDRTLARATILPLRLGMLPIHPDTRSGTTPVPSTSSPSSTTSSAASSVAPPKDRGASRSS